jgi:hypothetical protein
MRKLHLNVRKPSHGKCFNDVPGLANKARIFLNAEQDMSRPAPVGDEDRPMRRRLLAAAGILIELSSG